jgi:hypothetical protein
MTFLVPIDDLFKEKQRRYDSGSGIKPCWTRSRSTEENKNRRRGERVERRTGRGEGPWHRTRFHDGSEEREWRPREIINPLYTTNRTMLLFFFH